MPKEQVDLTIVSCSIDVAQSIEDTWRRIGGFADAGRFLGVKSRALTGQSGIGSMRQVGDAIVELMVGSSATSYIYVQTVGPMANYLYHGCVALFSRGIAACRLTYTVTYNQSEFGFEERMKQRQRIRERFQGAIENMKLAAGNEVDSRTTSASFDILRPS